MKIIFLDMDGVLNKANTLTDAELKKKVFTNLNEWENRWARMIEPDMMKRLNKIIEETGARIILSSSWRYKFQNQTNTFHKIVKTCGYTGEPLLGMTPTYQVYMEYAHNLKDEEKIKLHEANNPLKFKMSGLPHKRGYEIQMWLDETKLPIERFIILDDAHDMAHLKEYLIQTQWSEGLQREQMEEAIRRLNND